ncbi:non-ribosomal peptide synthetase [Micromonospora craniellae]|uniref:Amino acid adenylation domain-containing protein n=1 Tax=Micromonospora craniellae TaxID=2294034 RepID=A0A372G623_9ACTN|nr:non-ribosomal peptide synthetase [Micromonospora craniellae]QOC90132.1 amino acid adenylation domain-containing protein [Micromonospora craniellae]RFS48481.1 amino acid adenylation domain-containing protein [Micromonospora craniellae]
MDRRPLTAAQQALCFAQLLDPTNPTFLCAHRVDIDGPLDIERLVKATELVTATAEVLGVGLATDGEQMWFTERPVPALEVIEVSGEAEVTRFVDEDLAVALPLTGAAALYRHALLRHGPERSTWYLRAHHVLLDGYGFAMLTERIIAAYTASGGDARVPAGFRPLVDLHTDEQTYLASERATVDREFWLDRLRDAGGPVSPGHRVAAPAHRHAVRHIEFPEAVGDGIRAAADRLDATWAELVFAAVTVYLYRSTGVHDLVLGMPVAGRYGTAAARVPASVVNVLPIRVTLPAAATVRQVLDVVRRELREALRHQRYRYEWLQRDLGLVGTGQRLFGPQINIKPFRRDLAFGGGVTGRVRYLATGPTEDLEVTIGLQTDTGRLDLTVDANPSCYDDEELDGHARRIASLLTRYATLDPDTPVDEVGILTEAERDLVLRAWNDTAHPVPDRTLTQLLVEQAARTPHAAAVRAEGAELTYAELHERADRLARWLVARGARPGTLVGVAMPRGLDLMVALLGVLRSGAGYLPLDLSYPADRIAFMLADARPVWVLDALPDLTASPASGAPADPAGAPASPDGAAGPTDTAYAIYTSGSTGRPKGVLVPHRAIVNRLLWMQHRYGLTHGERVLQKTPSGFDVSVWEFFWPLIVGATVVMARPDGHRDPRYLAEVIVEEKTTTVHFVPSMLRVFLAEETTGRTAAVLRRVICSGEELPDDLVRRHHDIIGAELHNLYGPTEAAVDVTSWQCSPDDPPGPVPIGHPVWNTRIYLLDPGGAPVPPGAVGELHIAGRQVATGYLDRPELTAERFVPDPWAGPDERMYRTGDLARWRPDGAIEFLGRADGQVKVRGVRVELGEIEATLNQCPGVRQAAVTLVDDRLFAYLVGSLDIQRCRAHLGRTLPEQMIPAVFVSVEELPLTPSGKLDRQALARAAREQPDAVSPPSTGSTTPPRTPTEIMLAELVAEVLGTPVPGSESNFFDLGGHSLSAATLVRRIRTELGVALPLAAVFAAPTIAGMAARLHEGTRGDEALGTLLPLRPAAGGPALFCVHPAGGLAWCYAGLLPHVDPSVAVYGLQSAGLTGPLAARSLAETAQEYVRQIRAVRPHGPYALAGWSVGGVLAHAVAVELRAAGESVSVLALLDAYPGDQWRDLPAPSRVDALRALLFMAGYDESSVVGELNTESVLALLTRSGSPLAELDRSVLAKVPEVVADNARMMRTHQHRKFDGEALLFVAAAPRAEDWLDPQGWSPYVAGLTIHPLDCTHPAMVRPEQLRRVGREVSRRLRGS